ncbi:MAG: DUF4286 family protein [Bacteroidia bacterium]
MIIYNVTISINPTIETEVLSWLREEHIPEVMATNLFLEYNMYKVIENHLEKTHNSYAIQYHLESWDKFEEYVTNHAEGLKAKTKEKYGENLLAFRTFLERM